MDTVEIKVPCQRNVCRDAKNGRYYAAGRSGDVFRRNQCRDYSMSGRTKKKET